MGGSRKDTPQDHFCRDGRDRLSLGDGGGGLGEGVAAGRADADAHQDTGTGTGGGQEDGGGGDHLDSTLVSVGQAQLVGRLGEGEEDGGGRGGCTDRQDGGVEGRGAGAVLVDGRGGEDWNDAGTKD